MEKTEKDKNSTLKSKGDTPQSIQSYDTLTTNSKQHEA
jgi:hypothetical protein